MNALVQRLISARKAAGVSQEAAATRLGMSRPTFIAIEKGTRLVKPEELIALADLYGTTLNRLVRHSSPPAEVAPHLRAAAESAGEDVGVEEAVAKLTEFVDDYLFLKDRMNAPGGPAVPPQPARPNIPVERFAEICAIEQRRTLGLGDRQPIGSLRKTLDEVGVHVFIDGLNSKLAGLYAFVNGFGYCILVNSGHPPTRRRWTIAHEYGHFLFDRDRPGVDYLAPMRRKPENERFADAFAAHFLMPSAGVEHRFHDTYLQKGDVNVGDVLGMADYFGVSLMAMVLRLEALGLIKKGSWDGIKATGARVRDIREESGLQSLDEKESVEIFPDRYIMLAIAAWSSESITTSQFAKLLRKTVVEARDLASSRSSLVDETNGFRSSISLSLSDSVVHKERQSA
ncbi:helix-turn-helix domain-containing protein [Tahibacter caeni]|uniref:helix-turn-helix domain-containing protein n=1 Tax=Tahibacter caeni TaxID=1453545 RepID=UPI002147F5FB|nr:XRE family transcriptional regulator [Tahibacter caeni]